MKNKEVAHLWANQSRERASGSHFFFERETIYSYGYHYPVAKLTEIEGRPVVFFNPQRHSNSTARHSQYARRAIHSREVYFLPMVVWGNIATERDLSIAVEAEAVKVQGLLEETKKSKRESAKRRRAIKASEARYRIDVYPGEVLEWKAGGNLPQWYHEMPTALRISGETIETSRGARVPISVCRKVWPLLRQAVADHEAHPSEFKSFFEIPDFPWGDYKGISLRKDNGYTLVVGCHIIPFCEVREIAIKLNLEPATA